MLSGDILPPPPLRAHVTAVGDDDRGVLACVEGDFVGRAPADDPLDTALLEAFEHEGVVAEVCLGVVVGMPQRLQPP